MGKHNANPDPPKSKIIRFAIWSCTEGKHLIIITAAGLPAILAYEIFLAPHGSFSIVNYL